jgi:hypothetical protein
VDQPVDLHAAATYEEFTRRLLISTANGPQPYWKADSFFRRYVPGKDLRVVKSTAH